MTAKTASKADVFYRRLLLTKFFSHGWGNISVYRKILAFRKDLAANRLKLQDKLYKDFTVYIDGTRTNDSYSVVDGHFKSPLGKFFPGILPKESEIARFQMVLPLNWKWERDKAKKPVCLHLAGTGDHYFWRRRNLMAKPLIKETSIGSIILENPFYGVRKPKDQLRSSLKCVADLFVMGSALMLESCVLLNWCEQSGYGPLGITGVSMGGNMASIAATAWHKPIAIVPCLSWTTASPVFTKGVLSRSISWNVLQKQLTDTFKKQLIECRVDSDLDLESVNTLDIGPIELARRENHEKKYVLQNTWNEMMSLNTHSFIKSAFKGQIKAGFRSAFCKLDQIPSFLKGQNEGPGFADQETVQVMKTVMDNLTHLTTYSVPVDPSLAIFVVATQDGYVPWSKEINPEEVWPGAEVRYLDAGHIAASLRHTEVFRKAIKDAFNKVPLS